MSFSLDRMNVPTFYTPKDSNNGHHLPSGIILAESGSNRTFGWITVGYVSRQTPFGQGTYLGFKRSELQKADPMWVLAAITIDHPHGGAAFRPKSEEAIGAEFHIIMSGAIDNWSTDSGKPSILPVSRRDLFGAQKRAIQKHEALLARWDEITRKQIEAIKKQ
jgi:hypothetical protein